MKLETVIGLVMAEIDRAEKIHPVWPRNLIHAGMVVSEEQGELSKAILDHDEGKGSKRQMIIEAVHTAAMAIRFLKNIEETEENE
ncbi:MAG: hypothetical protein BWY31_00586 [Lentisphaerae bacterium ADurb.Bin242]|nr:MAG: hypothetical protein BWY31_00586 [Lentisphaerae bacterium ADurb.Bin242]